MKNLEGNYTKAGEDYDNGSMLDCYYDAGKSITECNDVIGNVESQIKSMEERIDEIEVEIEGLSGYCSDECSDLVGQS